MATEQNNDDKLFDRLADGELTHLERRALLESLDQQPDGWRRCALAFLEAQSWREQFALLARDSHEHDEEKTSPDAHFVTPASVERKMYSHYLATGLQWFAIAAGLLLAFTVGWFGRDRGWQFAGRNANQQIARVTPSPAGPTSAAANNALTLFVRDASGRNTPVRVPLVDAETLDRQFGIKFQPTFPDDVRDKLQRQGFAVQSKRQYAPLWLENGRPMIVPVEDTKIVPVNNKAF